MIFVVFHVVQVILDTDWTCDAWLVGKGVAGSATVPVNTQNFILLWLGTYCVVFLREACFPHCWQP